MENRAALAEIKREVYRRTGVSMGESKATLLYNRVLRRVKKLDLDGIEDYLEILRGLRKGDPELAAFIDVVTTHKTSFFRTAHVWEFMAEEFGRVLEKQREIRFWSAACSTGQEVYSLASLAESLRGSNPGMRWTGLASDVSEIMVQQAAEGLFSAEDVRQATQANPSIPFENYFDPEVDGLRKAKALLRKGIQFTPHNLMEKRVGQFDVVFLRNVIIYFNDEDKRKVIEQVRSTIRTNGLLVLGESESMPRELTGFEYLAPCIYRVSH